MSTSSTSLEKTSRQFSEWVLKNTRTISITGGALLMVAVAVAGWLNQREKTHEKGAAALFTAKKTLDDDLKKVATELAPVPVTDKKKGAKTPPVVADASTIAYQAFSVDQKLGAGVGALQGVQEQFSSAPAGYEAAMILGDLYFKHQSAEKALGWYEKALSGANSSLRKSMTWVAIGVAQENLGKMPEAVTAFEKALSAGEKATHGEVLLALARAQAAAGQKDAALKSYDRVIQEHASTEYARMAEGRKALLQ